MKILKIGFAIVAIIAATGLNSVRADQPHMRAALGTCVLRGLSSKAPNITKADGACVRSNTSIEQLPLLKEEMAFAR